MTHRPDPARLDRPDLPDRPDRPAPPRAAPVRPTRAAGRPPVPGLAALAVVLGLAACTAGDPGPADAVPSGAGDAPRSVVDVVTAPGTATDDYVGALADVELTGCEPAGDGWRFGGEVTNPTQDVQGYRIYVSLMTGTDTLGVVEVDVAGVEAAQTRSWEGAANASGDDLVCVLRVERTAD